jgi:hypothetical protein
VWPLAPVESISYAGAVGDLADADRSLQRTGGSGVGIKA